MDNLYNAPTPQIRKETTDVYRAECQHCAEEDGRVSGSSEEEVIMKMGNHLKECLYNPDYEGAIHAHIV